MTKRRKFRRKKSELREWLEALGFALVVILFIRAFVVDLYSVSNNSMEGTLKQGDFVLVSKLHPGPRIPITPLTLPFTHSKLPWSKDRKSYLDWIQLPYRRMPGIGDIKHNDVLLFNHPEEITKPIDRRSFSAKRCVALPGEEFELDGEMVMVDGYEIEQKGALKFTYHIKCDSIMDLQPMLPAAIKISNKGDWRALLTKEHAEKLETLDHVTNVVRMEEKYGVGSEFIFPGSNKRGWNIDHFGPIKVPKAGDTIWISLQNLDLYTKLLTNHEGQQVAVDEGKIYLNQVPATYFVPAQDYFVVIGDNRHNSNDTRYWGFLPESHIVGTVKSVIYRPKSDAEQSNSYFESL